MQPAVVSPLQLQPVPQLVLSPMPQPLSTLSLPAPVCGPTIPKDCKVLTTLNGMCFIISRNNAVSAPIPSALRSCPLEIDIAFLMDGSESVEDVDFVKMKTFVITIIQSFSNCNSQFAVAQFSTGFEIHSKFEAVNDIDSWRTRIGEIKQQKGMTYTAKAINKLVNELFITEGGARQSAIKILIVITDGRSNDEPHLRGAVEKAEKKNVIRFAIGIGEAFDDSRTKQQLHVIASAPVAEHVFNVTDFEALDGIRGELEENIAIEGKFTDKNKEHENGLDVESNENGFDSVQSTGDSATMEFAQDGFTAVFTSNPQIGSYFGAEVCVVDLNSDEKTDLLLISAPTYVDSHSEGRVFVYFYSRQPYFTFSVVLVGMAGQRGRFGSSVASPADLNVDGFKDVLIGAPLEEDGQGSIYIFNGGVDQIKPTYSQRIAGSSVHSGLQFFGQALSQSSLDHSGDSLPDIAVGSKGAVLLLRTRPIVSVDVKVTHNPSKISTSETNCTKPLGNILTVCFNMSGYKHAITDLAANVSYTLKLDAKRYNHRAYFLPKSHVLSDAVNVKLDEVCKDHPFLIEACTEDHLNPLLNELMFTFEGLPSQSLENLQPVLLPWMKNTTLWTLDYEINCGSDNLCVDNLKMDFSFGSANIEVGIMQKINVTVLVENRGENSYNTHFVLSYPYGLSYRKIMPRVVRQDDVHGTWG
ncbi:integrin alpha-M-like protein [Labeo rohita]|uniref:Integrin alpha-M-like protein n=1 Tax=Labeo rohita TaxID=84645 RepID=A0A498NKZ3_LABRO|nr:integrin alpha-M-like protein [Labeo rohita]